MLELDIHIYAYTPSRINSAHNPSPPNRPFSFSKFDSLEHQQPREKPRTHQRSSLPRSYQTPRHQPKEKGVVLEVDRVEDEEAGVEEEGEGEEFGGTGVGGGLG